MHTWLLLTATLPASPSGLRVRTWRALKASGCAALRDGVYLLPASAATATDLWQVEQAIRDAGAKAHMLTVQARHAEQEREFIALFDRSEQYAAFTRSLQAARRSMASMSAADLRRNLRTLDQQWRNLQATDFFPTKAAADAGAALATLREETERRLSPGEPAPGLGSLKRLRAASYAGKTWATRRRPWVDRLATAWLILRFVDPSARFIWIAGARQCPKSAIGFDFDGATFTHVADKVTFEVVAHRFGLEGDAGIVRLGQLVHCIDVGGIPVDEAVGVELLVRGLQAQHESDDALLAASLPLFDSLYAALRLAP